MSAEWTCDRVEDLLPEILDGSLSQDLIDGAVGHIATCEACTFTKGQYDNMQTLYKDHGSLRLGQESKSRIRDQLFGPESSD